MLKKIPTSHITGSAVFEYYSMSEREKEKERETETEPDTEPRRITSHTTHTHLPFLPPSVVFLMIPDELLITFGDESSKFLTCPLSMVGY